MAQPNNPSWSSLWDEEAQLPPTYSNSTSPIFTNPSKWQKFRAKLPGFKSVPSDGMDIPMADHPASVRPPLNSLSERMLAIASSAPTAEERVAATNMVPQIFEKEIAYRKAIEDEKKMEKKETVERRDKQLIFIRNNVVGPLFVIAVFFGVAVLVFWLFKYF